MKKNVSLIAFVFSGLTRIVDISAQKILNPEHHMHSSLLDSLAREYVLDTKPIGLVTILRKLKVKMVEGQR